MFMGACAGRHGSDDHVNAHSLNVLCALMSVPYLTCWLITIPDGERANVDLGAGHQIRPHKLRCRPNLPRLSTEHVKRPTYRAHIRETKRTEKSPTRSPINAVVLCGSFDSGLRSSYMVVSHISASFGLLGFCWSHIPAPVGVVGIVRQHGDGDGDECRRQDAHSKNAHAHVMRNCKKTSEPTIFGDVCFSCWPATALRACEPCIQIGVVCVCFAYGKVRAGAGLDSRGWIAARLRSGGRANNI